MNFWKEDIKVCNNHYFSEKDQVLTNYFSGKND